jgi:CheY-like chemotaxis protein
MSGAQASDRVAYLLCDDLIFTSRIVGTGRDLGLTMQSARSSDVLLRLAEGRRPACVIVDLANPGLRLSELMARLAEKCPPLPRVVAYGSHVDTETLKAARQAGCDPVLPRSKFVEDLPKELARWCGSES